MRNNVSPIDQMAAKASGDGKRGEVLEEILRRKREQVEMDKKERPLAELEKRARRQPPARDFERAVARCGGRVKVVAELKRASPSRGLIRPDLDVERLARALSFGGASAISVLTEKQFFQGSLEYLVRVRNSVPLPVLCKDFVVDDYQVFEACAYGADAILLIVAVTGEEVLKHRIDLARKLALSPLVEVHTADEMEIALRAGTRLLGINNRDLRDFTVDLGTARSLLPLVPAGVTVIVESGINSPSEVAEFHRLGADAVLVGEAVMRQRDVERAVRELVEYGAG